RYDGKWSFVASGGYAANLHEVFLYGTGAYIGMNGNSRILLAANPAAGAHQNGTATPGAQRSGMTIADLTSAPLYIGAANSDIVQPCSGTPAPGNIAIASSTVCSGAAAGTSITAAGYSTGVTGLSFQWEESDDDGMTDTW